MKALKSRNTYQQAISSLIEQVDHIYCAIDEEIEIPQESKVTFKITGNENADLDKFLIMSEVKFQEGDHIFICDDDLIYPEDYVSMTLGWEIGKEINIGSYGGSMIEELPIGSYYKEKFTTGIWDIRRLAMEVKIPYSGVLYIHYTALTEKLIEALSSKGDMHLPFAGDLTVAGLLGALELKCDLLPIRKEDWFKHIEMDMSATIFESFKDNDYEQTSFVNKHGHLFVQEKKSAHYYPHIAIAVVSTRRRENHNFLVQCLGSIRKQIYPYYDIILIDNDYKIRTIGKCFNEAVREAKQNELEWIAFVGDDDTIAPDWLATIASGIREVDENVVCVTTNTTFHDEQEYAQQAKAPTGCWKVSFLLEHPFVEYAQRYVDSHQFERLKDLGKNIAKIEHSYGYYYRAHNGQASGHKAINGGDGHMPLIEKIMKENFK